MRTFFVAELSNFAGLCILRSTTPPVPREWSSRAPHFWDSPVFNAYTF